MSVGAEVSIGNVVYSGVIVDNIDVLAVKFLLAVVIALDSYFPTVAIAVCGLDNITVLEVLCNSYEF